MSQVKTTALVLALLAAIQPVVGSAISLRDEGDYINSVCRPKLADDADSTSAFVMPPCSAIEFIEGICKPSGTSALELEAHAQCMCKGSFFSQWAGCQKCQVFHGARSEQAVLHFQAALDIASKALCGSAKPTALFQDLFSSADNVAPYPTTGATTTNDAAPSKTAISLYFTPTGSSWGPGAVTGSASAALGTVAATVTTDFDSSAGVPTASGTGSNHSSSGAVSTTKSTSASSTSTTASPGMAAPTGVAMKGMLLAVAGGAMVAAL